MKGTDLWADGTTVSVALYPTAREGGIDIKAWKDHVLSRPFLYHIELSLKYRYMFVSDIT